MGPLATRLSRVILIADGLYNGREPSTADHSFLHKALTSLLAGATPETAFAVQSKRGERRHREAFEKSARLWHAVKWADGAKDKDKELGLGLSGKKAFAEAGRHFRLAPAAIKNAWYEARKNKQQTRTLSSAHLQRKARQMPNII